MPGKIETYISVDIETAGPHPSKYSLLSIGACLVDDPNQCFYVEIKPINSEVTSEALEVSQLDLAVLQESGIPQKEAMSRFSRWVDEVTPSGSQPIFVAFNAPFDWMFVNDYFYRYLGSNPFGHKALDIKAFYMGLIGVSWDETGWQTIANRYLDSRPLRHHALQDAKDQAAVFQQMLGDQFYRGLATTG
jgi:DNA polymerase III alpha subunit (gram-positive type)